MITDIDDAALEPLRRLRHREERERTGLFWTEGTRFLYFAREQNRNDIETLVVAPELLAHPVGRQIARELRRASTPCLTVSADVFRSLSLSAEPQGIGAVVRQRWEPMGSVRPSQRGLCWVAVDRVQSPGNLGTILRTSDAVGAAGLILLGDATDPYNPATVRATMGSIFTQRLVRATPQEFMDWKRRTGCLLVGTSPSASKDYREITYPSPVVLFMGWERQGLTKEHQEFCDVMVRIPMVGRSDSLNVAIAAGVLLYEVFNQRREGQGRHHSSNQQRRKKAGGKAAARSRA